MRLLLAGLLFAAAAPAQEAPADPLDRPVLIQFGETWSTRDVLERIRASNPSLVEQVERSPSYRDLFLQSPVFVAQVRAFSHLLAVERAGVPEVGEAELRAEAEAWARDHGKPQPAERTLVTYRMEIEWRARLIAEQPREFSTAELRTHMLRSIPEFFCDLQVSWIRRPLFDPVTGRALTEGERRRAYELLEEVAERLLDGELLWEDAVQEFSLDERTRRRGGAVGLVNRRDTKRYEEAFLRHLFEGHGVKMLQEDEIRGPIMGDLYIYLARIESVLSRGVVDLELRRAQIERSLREYLLRQRLDELLEGSERRILAPLLPETEG